jgi:hypothetical protein
MSVIARINLFANKLLIVREISTEVSHALWHVSGHFDRGFEHVTLRVRDCTSQI